MSNLVQVEFSHAGRKNIPRLEDLLAECAEQVIDNLMLIKMGVEPRSRLKTVVRFYDTDGVLTAIAQESKRLEWLRLKCTRDCIDAGWFRQKLLDHQSRRLATESIALKEKCKPFALIELRKTIKASKVIAIEKADQRFRLARKNELWEIFESAESSAYARLFVFEPNNLLSQNNIPVAHAI